MRTMEYISGAGDTGLDKKENLDKISNIIQESDFDEELKESVKHLRLDGQIHQDNVFTFKDDILLIDDISVENWFREREEVLEERGGESIKIGPSNLVRRNGGWEVRRAIH